MVYKDYRYNINCFYDNNYKDNGYNDNSYKIIKVITVKINLKKKLCTKNYFSTLFLTGPLLQFRLYL